MIYSPAAKPRPRQIASSDASALNTRPTQQVEPENDPPGIIPLESIGCFLLVSDRDTKDNVPFSG